MKTTCVQFNMLSGYIFVSSLVNCRVIFCTLEMPLFILWNLIMLLEHGKG